MKMKGGLDCEVCKKFTGQSGNCRLYRRNCLAFEREPRGKRILRHIAVEIDPDAETEIVKPGGKVSLLGKTGYEAEGEVQKIEYVDFPKWEIGMQVYLFETDLKYLFQCKDKHNRFKVIQGGKGTDEQST